MTSTSTVGATRAPAAVRVAGAGSAAVGASLRVDWAVGWGSGDGGSGGDSDGSTTPVAHVRGIDGCHEVTKYMFRDVEMRV